MRSGRLDPLSGRAKLCGSVSHALRRGDEFNELDTPQIARAPRPTTSRVAIAASKAVVLAEAGNPARANELSRAGQNSCGSL